MGILCSELRIGNLVHHDGKIVKVVGIEEKHINILKDPFQCYFHTVPINGLESIPLTEEIILNCGFIKCKIAQDNYNKLGMSIWKCNDIFLCYKNGIVIKSLDQLQNLYYVLTGKELKYNE